VERSRQEEVKAEKPPTGIDKKKGEEMQIHVRRSTKDTIGEERGSEERKKKQRAPSSLSFSKSLEISLELTYTYGRINDIACPAVFKHLRGFVCVRMCECVCTSMCICGGVALCGKTEALLMLSMVTCQPSLTQLVHLLTARANDDGHSERDRTRARERKKKLIEHMAKHSLTPL
jgi:hypothetical protein